MSTHCAKSCDMCDRVDAGKDRHKKCADWAAAGECEKQIWMRSQCAESCEHHKRTKERELR
jgi:hypothetical protein